MKKLFITLAALAMTFSAFAQGTITFATRTLNARVTFTTGESAGNGPVALTAQLAVVGAGGALTLLTPTTTFQTSATAQWFVNTVTVAIPGFATGTTPTLRMLAYSSSFASYDDAKANGGWWGFSNDIVAPGLGGAGTPPVTPPNLVGLQSFTVTTVPEPTTYALLGLGGLALALRRRK